MAIQKAYTHESGVVLASAYHRILTAGIVHGLNVVGEPEDYVDVRVGIYKDSQARGDGNAPIAELNFGVKNVYPTTDFDTYFDVSILNQENVNVVKQCYEYLKTQSNLYGIDYTTGVTDV